jgi:PAT family beta-lactamase induction signal transducer AmpG
MLMLGFVIRSICWILYFFVADTYMLLLVQFLLGIGEAVGTSVFDVIFAEHLNNGKHINAYSNWKIISNLSLAIACLVGGFIVYLVGFKLLFLIMAVLGIASTLIVYFQHRKLL